MELKLLFEGKLRDEEVTVDLSLHRAAVFSSKRSRRSRRHSPPRAPGGQGALGLRMACEPGEGAGSDHPISRRGARARAAAPPTASGEEAQSVSRCRAPSSRRLSTRLPCA